MTKVHYKPFDDNSGALKLVDMPKLRLTTKIINHLYYHFCSHAKQKPIMIHQVKIYDRIADILTRIVPQYISFRNYIKSSMECNYQ